MAAILIEPQLAEPLSLSEAKNYLRVSHDADDALIQSMISAARVQVEAHTRRALLTQVWREPALRAPDVVCPVIAERSGAWQRQLRAERLAAAGSPRTDEALAEWLSLRDQARACRTGR